MYSIVKHAVVDCSCNVNGTVNGSNICTPDNGGQCPCKKFTTSRKCDMCIEGFFGLTADNLQGIYNFLCF